MTNRARRRLPARLPIPALLALMASGAAAQSTAPAPAPTPAADPAPVLPAVRAKAAPVASDKDSVRATTTTIGKGKQDLRDVPQSVTVVTERLIDDRNLDTMKDALRNTAGITFLAAEGGEEDIRLRGFPLQASGDVFVDGIRDPAFYDRDTFFLERLEVLRGSAGMLFGRGSTGGAVNMVTKAPRLVSEKQIDFTLGSNEYKRVVGEFNFKLDDSSAYNLGLMATEAENNGAGSSLDKWGFGAGYRTGIGEKNEFSIGFYHLNNNNGMNYGMPFIRKVSVQSAPTSELLPLPPERYYGMASDYNAGTASTLTLGHIHRFSPRTELNTRVRIGNYERDQRAGTVRFAAAALQPDGQLVSLQTFGPNTVITRGTQLKIQDMQNLFVQSDLSSRFDALGVGHELLAGVDAARERKQVYGARTAAQGGVTLTKPTTTVGMPDDGAWVDESLRVLRKTNEYEARAFGIYAQDLIQILPRWKLLLGLRYDRLSGDYDTFAIPNTAPGPVTTANYRMKVSELSKRAGLIFQPSDKLSFHFSAATSFNTSGDAYSLNEDNENIPPEQSINVELGGRWESANGNFTSRFALFRSTKLHERNTDPLVDLVTLSGKRHAAGIEIDLTGRLAPGWEVYGSYMWLPVARIDEGVPGAEGEGARPSLTPRHSGTIWTTYQLTPQWRIGGGLNARSSQTPLRNPVGVVVPKFVTGDLMAEYTVLRDQFVIKANLVNVTDKLYADSIYPGHYIPGPGRMLQVTGTWKF
jgi:catecholate siderophore receptor